jgi:hypothetical protein
MVDFLRYETVDELWSIFGELRACQRSPRPDEYAYFFIDQVSENFALSLVIPFDPTGQLSHCARHTSPYLSDTLNKKPESVITQWTFVDLPIEVKHLAFIWD